MKPLDKREGPYTPKDVKRFHFTRTRFGTAKNIIHLNLDVRREKKRSANILQLNRKKK